MNFNGSGGLMLMIIAALWIWVFVPSWFKRSEERQSERKFAGEIRSELRDAKRNVTGTVAALAERNYRLSVTRRIFGTLLLSSIVAAGFLSVQAITDVNLWFAVAGCLAVAALSIATLRKATKQARALVARSHRTRSAIFTEASGGVGVASIADDRAWEPNPLPAPRQRIGELETPVLAEVISIEPTRTLSSQELDEILRRRRANG
ncbi:hypothetical protein [Rhodoluna limnophila]|uniref:hypothetical protein n=1 Tax=Rhodoluna limnophila TaxID=232537 RepID=UPI001105C65B|nr:hypothetical protein [Rhodoluna limnophila]